MNALNPPESRDTTCPECGTDHEDGATLHMARRLEAERVARADVTAQRDALLKSMDWRTLELVARELEVSLQPGSTAPIERIIETLRGRATAERAAIAAVEGDANVPF